MSTEDETYHRTIDTVDSIDTQDTLKSPHINPADRIVTKETIKPLEIVVASAASNNGKVVYLGIVFMLLYTAFNPVQNLMSMLFKQIGEDYLGVFALLVLNQAFAIGSLLAPRLAPKLSYRNAFTLASFTFVLLIAVGKLASNCGGSKEFICQSRSLYVLMLIASVCTGIGSSLLWFCQSVYVVECSTETNKGKMFGIFMALMQSSQITGALLATVLLKQFGVAGFFQVQTILACIATVAFLLVRNPTPLAEKKDDDMYNTSDRGQVELAKGAEEEHDSTSFKHLISFMNRDKMRNYDSASYLIAYSFGFMVTNLSKLTSATLEHLSQEEANEKVGYVFLALGVFEVVASQVCGTFFDKYKSQSVKMIIVFNLLVVIAQYVGVSFNNYNMFFLAAICYGFCDAGALVVFGALISSKFREKSEPFAIFRFVNSMGQAIFILMFLVLERSRVELQFIVFAFFVAYAWKSIPKFL